MGYEEITHLGYVLGLAPLVQSDQSSSWVPSGTTPSQSSPAFFLPLPEVLGLLEGALGLADELRIDGVLRSSAIIQNQGVGNRTSQLRTFCLLRFGVYF